MPSFKKHYTRYWDITGGAPIKSETQPPKRVLVVDDSQVQAKSLGMLLELMGHEVRLAYDGPGAPETLAEFHPDAALVDVGLPGMNGYEVARRIREHERPLLECSKVIFRRTVRMEL